MPALSNRAKALIDYCRENGRLCPQPNYWNKLWKMLPDREQKRSGGWSPSLPLLLAVWSDTPGIEKMLRLHEHIRWADKHGSIEQVNTYLRSLTEEQWFHGSD